MNRISMLAYALVVALSSRAIILAQTDSTREISQSDSLMLRLKNAKHVGLTTDERLSGYILYLYTPAQREQNLASLATYRENLTAWNARIKSLDEKRQTAQRERASIDELNAMTHERNRLQSERPDSPFASRIYLYDVVKFGVDYVEIAGAEKPREFTLIPFAKICKVIVKTSADDPISGEPSVAR